MKKIFCILGVLILNASAYTTEKTCYSNMSAVLNCFLQHNDGVYQYEFVSENNKNPNLTIKTYILYSQKWPIKKHTNIPTTTWRHKLVFYIPKQIAHTKALIYVNGGYNRSKNGIHKFYEPASHIDYATIALHNKAPVIEAEDIPNQFLFFDGTPKKEDQLIAYTYKMVIANPLQNAYLAGHLPMVKAIIKTMDAAQEILKCDYDLEITGFILAGASKRGWAVWLASLEDERVQAIAPIVINVLNTKKSITHICKSYGGTCPPALNDYVQAGIIDLLDTEAATKLMQIVDPFSYLDDTYHIKYKKRLAIPKYMINASGDDFFVPDSPRWYLKSLPGSDNYMRYLPNSMHYFQGNMISNATNSSRSINESLDSYFHFILHNTSLPKVQWLFHDHQLELESSIKPREIKLWAINNKCSRDFRCINNYSKPHLLKRKILSYFTQRICDNCYTANTIAFDCENEGVCKINTPLPQFKYGWQATFAEIRYDIDRIPFIVTTEVNIKPDVMPSGA